METQILDRTSIRAANAREALRCATMLVATNKCKTENMTEMRQKLFNWLETMSYVDESQRP